MNRFIKYGSSKKRVIYRTHDDESTTIEGCSYTPQQLSDMAEKGIPVTSQNNTALQSHQGHQGSSWDIPLEQQRGTDISDLWLAQRRSRSSLAQAYQADSENKQKISKLQAAENERLIALGKAAQTPEV